MSLQTVTFCLLLIFAQILTQVLTSNQLPVFENEPKNQTKILRDSAVFHCQTKDPKNTKVTWYKNGRKVTGFETMKHYIITSDGDLVIQGVRGGSDGQESDEGEYYCSAENSVGVVESAHAWLTIYYMADKFALSPQNASINFGQTILLQCGPPESHPDATVMWLKDQVEIDPAKDSHYSLVGYNLAIENAGNAHSGFYTCVASNGHQEKQSLPASVVVGTEPYFTKTLKQYYSMRQGDSLSLECRAAGSPNPSIYWMKGDFTKLDNSNQKYIIKRGSLQIVDLDQNDSGTYKCIASNNIKTIVSQTNILVAGLRPDFLKTPPLETIVTVGESLSLPCQALDSNTEIFWTLPSDETPYLLKGQEEGHLSVDVRGSLNIDSVQLSDAGQYKCSIVALKGADNFVKTDLIVKQPTNEPPPLLQIEPFNQTVPVGSNVLLPCFAEGSSSLPTIHWTFNEQPLSKYQRHLLLMNGSLHITNAKESDTGFYTCTADNAFGQNSAQSYLKITSSSSSSSNSAEMKMFSHLDLPGAPKFFMISEIGLTDVSLQWFPGYNHETTEPISYRIDFYSDGVPRWRSVYTSAVADRDANSPVYETVRGLSLSSKHLFTVRSCSSLGCGKSVQMHYKIELLGSVTPDSDFVLGSFSNFEVDLFMPTLINSSVVVLSWRVLSNPTSVTSFTIEVEEDKTNKYDWSKKQPIVSEILDRTQRSLLLRNLKPATSYNITFSAKMTNGVVVTKKQSLETLQAPPSLAPDSVTAMQNGSKVQIHWIPPSSDSINGVLTGYVILVYDKNGRSLYNISVGNVTHSEINLSTEAFQTIVIRVAARSMAPGIGPQSSPITLTFGEPPNAFSWNDSYTWILAIIGVFVWVLLIVLAFLVTRRWFNTYRKTPPMKFRKTLLKQIYQDSEISHLAVESEMMVSAQIDQDLVNKCPAAANYATQTQRSKEELGREVIPFAPFYSSAPLRNKPNASYHTINFALDSAAGSNKLTAIYENANREPQLIIPSIPNYNRDQVPVACEFGDSNPFINIATSGTRNPNNTGRPMAPNVFGTLTGSRLMQLPARPRCDNGDWKSSNQVLKGSSHSSRSGNNSPTFGDDSCKYCQKVSVEDIQVDNSHRGLSPPRSDYASVDPAFYCDNYTALEMCVNGSD